MEGFKSITLVFENCEEVEFPANAIGDFDLSDISRSIRRVACNSITECTSVKSVFIELFKCGDNAAGYPHADNITKFDRISSHNDITTIQVDFGDRQEEFLVDYDEGDEAGLLGAANVNQKVWVSKPGNLYITIAKGKDVEDFVNKEEKDNAEEMNLHMDMMDIGDIDYPETRYGRDSLPAFYRYVQLREGGDGWQDKFETAMRVPDPERGWKFLHIDGGIVNIPDTWQYYSDKMQMFISSQNAEKGLDLASIQAKYGAHSVEGNDAFN